MSDKWDFYDRIIDEIPDSLDAVVDFVQIGEIWTIVGAGDFIGMAVTVNEQDISIIEFARLAQQEFTGMPLKDAACYCESWNFPEASVGTAALNAYINSPEHLREMNVAGSNSNGFDAYKNLAAGKKAAIIGHFDSLERFLTESEICVLERSPRPGDFPDSACEYILPEMDYSFITGSSFINKTLPRLLEISNNPVILGPSTPMSSVLLEHGAIELSGFSPDLSAKQNAVAVCSGDARFKKYGRQVTVRL